MLTWEAAYARAFQIQLSGTGTTWSTVYSTTTGTGGTQTLNVSGTGRYLRVYMTQRATPYGYSLWEIVVRNGSGQPPSSPPPSSPPPGGFWGDTSTIPPAQNVVMVKILNRTNGRYPDSQVYWSFNGQTRSIAEQPYIDMPANSAGRMYFYLGTPNSQYADFIEFTVGPNVFNGNTTRVDAFGLKLAMRLHADDGYDASVGEDQATFAEDRAVTFQRFVDAVPAEFKHLGQIQAPYRIPSPGNSSQFRAGRAVRGLLLRVRLVRRCLGGHVGHLRLRRVAGQQPADVRRAQPARRAPAGRATAQPGVLLPGRAGELLLPVLARPGDQQAVVRVPVRRLRRTVVVRVPRRPDVPPGGRRLVPPAARR